MSADCIGLYEALEMCIEQFKSKCGINRIIVGDTASGAFCKPDLSENICDDFEKVIETDSHVFTEICICMEGNLAMQLGKYIVDIQEGETCLIFPGTLHAELTKKGSSYLALWMCINFDTIALHLSGKKGGDGHFYTLDGCTIKYDRDYNPVIAYIKEEVGKKQQYYLEIAELEIMRLLISILREVGNPRNHSIETKPWKETLVLEIQKFIEKHYNRNIRLSDISQELCISVNYVNSIFKSMTGKTIIRYVEEYRIDRAKELLKRTEHSINSIASDLGYYDQYHFSKIFKKETGFTPSQFRKMYIARNITDPSANAVE